MMHWEMVGDGHELGGVERILTSALGVGQSAGMHCVVA